MENRAIAAELNADRPITSASEDLLSRGSFCEALANSIRNWSGSESLVIGLYGAWGTGKTSVKNLVISNLDRSRDVSSIIHFNPWTWSGEDRLQTAFFEEIGKSISLVQDAPEELAQTWKKYAARLTLGGTALEHLKSAAEFAAVPWAPMILGGISDALRKAGSLSEKAADAHEASGRENLEDLKQSLADELAKLSRPILLVLDDIDRLTDSEIRLLFRLIKANSDFPNLVFLMLFDRKVVENALDDQSHSGREYMEKIVQVGFHIPEVQQIDLDRLLSEGLNGIFGRYSGAIKLDDLRWHLVYSSGLKSYFDSLRRVRRFLSGFSFYLGLFWNQKSLEVDPIDLIAVEALRVFEPDLYATLSKNPQIVFGLDRSKSLANGKSNDIEGHRNLIENWLTKASTDTREAAGGVLREIFPQIDSALRDRVAENSEKPDWLRDLRICHSQIFDRYFTMTIPEGDVSQALIEEVLSSTSEKNRIKGIFDSINSPRDVAALLNRLEVYGSQISLDDSMSFITAIFDIGEKFQHEYPGSFDIPADIYARGLIRELLFQESVAKKRGERLLKCLEQTTGHWMPLRLISIEQPDEGQLLDEHRCLFDERTMQIAIAWGLEKIRTLAKSNSLTGLRLSFYLMRWQRWAGEQEPREWARNYIDATPRNAFQFMVAFARHSVFSDGTNTHAYWAFSLPDLEKFVDLDHLFQQLAPYAEETLSDGFRQDVEEHRDIYQAILKEIRYYRERSQAT
ncbi:MAG: KAP family NTPase [bacterium]|nr:KAP family NTPase [bacterium]